MDGVGYSFLLCLLFTPRSIRFSLALHACEERSVQGGWRSPVCRVPHIHWHLTEHKLLSDAADEGQWTRGVDGAANIMMFGYKK